MAKGLVKGYPWLVRQGSDIYSVDGGVNSDVKGLGTADEFTHQEPKEKLDFVLIPAVVGFVGAVRKDP